MDKKLIQKMIKYFVKSKQRLCGIMKTFRLAILILIFTLSFLSDTCSFDAKIFY